MLFSPSFVETVGLILICSVVFPASICVFDVSLMWLLTNLFDRTFAFVDVVSKKSVLMKSNSMLDNRDEISSIFRIPLVIIDSKQHLMRLK